MNQRQPVTNRVAEPHTFHTKEELKARRSEQASQHRLGVRKFLAGVAIGTIGTVGAVIGFRAAVDHETTHQAALRQQEAPLVDEIGQQPLASGPKIVHPEDDQR
jgi:hypothetical protein